MTMNQRISVLLIAALSMLAVVRPASAGPAVAAGAQHSVVLTDGGVVWTWGANSYGQLGDGTTTPRLTPMQIMTISGVTAIASGDYTTYALKSDGTIVAWGYNGQGQVGDGTTTLRYSPTVVSGLSNVIAIAAGTNHALALKSDGTVWAWGYNTAGQLGDGTTTMRTSPVQVTSLGTTVVAIGAAANHSHAVKADGSAWGWGENGLTQTGDGTTTTPRTSPVQTSGLSTMTAVDAGINHAFAWDSTGSLKAWGFNGNGQIGDGTTTWRMTPVSIAGMSGVRSSHGSYHTVAAKSDGTVWAWGYNYYGQVGDNNPGPNRLTPVQLTSLDGVVSVSAGMNSSMAVSSDGRVWTWGYNGYGQLGDGHIHPAQRPDATQRCGLCMARVDAGLQRRGRDVHHESDRHRHLRNRGRHHSLHNKRYRSDGERSHRRVRRDDCDEADDDAQGQSVARRHAGVECERGDVHDGRRHAVVLAGRLDVYDGAHRDHHVVDKWRGDPVHHGWVDADCDLDALHRTDDRQHADDLESDCVQDGMDDKRDHHR
jgi:alpha-tubulin suppressor-like RCC1 family protein